jgi:hypothetical protein
VIEGKKSPSLRCFYIDVLWNDSRHKWVGEIGYGLNSEPYSFGSSFFKGTPIITGTGGLSHLYRYELELDPKDFPNMYHHHLKAQTSNIIFDTNYDFLD